MKTISCSYYHSILNTLDGVTFVFGRNDFGQLGLGDVTDRIEPTILSLPSPSNTFCCGQYHTVILTMNNLLYSIGKNDSNECGLPLLNPYETTPRLVPMINKDIPIISIASGYYHTLVLYKNGKVYGFGRNENGQLGLPKKIIYTDHIEQIYSLNDVITKDIYCGCYHSIVVDQNNIIYSFGKNNQNQLGIEDTSDHPNPIPLRLFQGKIFHKNRERY